MVVWWQEVPLRFSVVFRIRKEAVTVTNSRSTEKKLYRAYYPFVLTRSVPAHKDMGYLIGVICGD